MCLFQALQPVFSMHVTIQIYSKKSKNRKASDHYARLAGSGVATVVVANAAVSKRGIVSDFNLRKRVTPPESEPIGLLSGDSTT
jgi:hypothetical protein